jgi:hypothetical protein
MQKSTLRIIGNKAVLNIRERMCETQEELLASDKFRIVLDHCLENLKSKHSPLLGIFVNNEADKESVAILVKTLSLLVKYESHVVPHIFKESGNFLKDLDRLGNFVEYLYDYWRHFDRFIINDSEGDRLDKRPYRTFNETIEQLTHWSGRFTDIFRRILRQSSECLPSGSAGGEMAVISLQKQLLTRVRNIKS